MQDLMLSRLTNMDLRRKWNLVSVLDKVTRTVGAIKISIRIRCRCNARPKIRNQGIKTLTLIYIYLCFFKFIFSKSLAIAINLLKSELNMKYASILSPEMDPISGNRYDPKNRKNRRIWYFDSRRIRCMYGGAIRTIQ